MLWKTKVLTNFLKIVLIDKQILKKSIADKSANKKLKKVPINKQILKKIYGGQKC